MKARLLVVFVLLAVVAGTAAGAFAYFSSAQEVDGTISSGTLTLQLASGDSCENVEYGTISALPWDVVGMAPGQEVSGYLCMKNTGSIAAKQVTFEWQDIVNDPAAFNLAKQIILTEVMDSTDAGNVIAQFTSLCDTNSDGKTSLAELAVMSGRYGYPFDAVSSGSPFLPADGDQWLYMKFQFNPEAGNDYQGIEMSYDLIVTAEQEVVFP